jgi:hypothetical protein
MIEHQSIGLRHYNDETLKSMAASITRDQFLKIDCESICFDAHNVMHTACVAALALCPAPFVSKRAI